MSKSLEKFQSVYEFLYDQDQAGIIERCILAAVDEDQVFKDNQATISALVRERGDFFSSDREIAALIIALANA